MSSSTPSPNPLPISPSSKQGGVTPVATLLLIFAGLVGAAFTLGDAHAIERWGFIPEPLAPIPMWERALTMFTSLFVHLDAAHLLANLLLLAALGPVVERAAGLWRFAVVYFGAGAAGVLLHLGIVVWAQPLIASYPLVGASGAIAGLIGYSLLRFYRTRIPLLPRVLVPVWVMVLVWVVLQAAGGFLALAQYGVPVAYWAHLGGFFAGFMLGVFLKAGHAAQAEAWHERISEASERGPAAEIAAAEGYIRRKPNDPGALKRLYEAQTSIGHVAEAQDALLRLLRADAGFDHGFAALEVVSRGWASGTPQVERLKIAERIRREHPAAAEGLLRTILEEPESSETPYALLALVEIAAEEDPAGAKHYAARLERAYNLSPQAEIARRRWPELF